MAPISSFCSACFDLVGELSFRWFFSFSFGVSLCHMASEAYSAYLESDHWKALRLRKIKESGRICRACRRTKNIVVHHMLYRPNLEDAKLSDLLVLCRDCHDSFHRYLRTGTKRLQDFTLASTLHFLRPLEKAVKKKVHEPLTSGYPTVKRLKIKARKERKKNGGKKRREKSLKRALKRMDYLKNYLRTSADYERPQIVGEIIKCRKVINALSSERLLANAV